MTELDAIRAEMDVCNQKSGLHIQLVTNEPKAFEGSIYKGSALGCGIRRAGR